ncbi:MAG TPA: glycosyltransferase family 4 protein [Baekduia sp.]|nr:glycosyltransferase family 4 protein [Baekduia sp.]
MSARSGGRPAVAMLAFDFAEVCVPIANALSRMADVVLMLPERVVAPVRAAIVPEVRLAAFAMPRLRQPVRQAAMCRQILRTIDRLGCEVIHLQQGHLWFNLAMPLARGRALVVTIHDVAHHPGDDASKKTPQRVLDLAWDRADQLIVHTEATRRVVARRGGRDPRTVHVIPHVAIEPPRDRPPAAAEGLDVLFFGRIWPYKGLDHLIRAQPLITERVPGARIVIAGRGEDFRRYRDLMADPARFVVINEHVSIARRRELFERAAVVVLPYVEASQSGVVPLAYAASKPVVATTVGGLPEAVEDGRTGLLVAPGDERALADAVVGLLQHPARARAMGAAGRRKLEDEWSPATIAAQTLRVYDAALGHTPAAIGAAA